MTNLKVRWALQSDLRRMIDIEKKCFDIPWDTEDFKFALGQKNTIAMVLTKNDLVIGHVIYQLGLKDIIIVNMAISPKYQRQGYGRYLVKFVTDKLLLTPPSETKRERVSLMVSDTNLSAHLFLKAIGFKAVKVEVNGFGPNHDGYHFVYSVDGPKIAVAAPVKKTRTRKSREKQ